ncbi:hypothetical protein BDN71DRAFT_1394118, partial [Pleurotus eryngii]
FLSSNWEHSVCMDILCLQQGAHTFIKFLLEIMGKNNLLAGIDSFFNNESLRDTMNANMDRDLAHECNKENLNPIIIFCDWLDEVKHLNEKK